ncbi:MAG: AlbA family DNA-binding domain-containing protein [Nitrososphaerales archaeon]
MQNGIVSESDRLALSEMIRIFRERENSYGGVKVSMALYNSQIRIDAKEWRNVLACFELTPAAGQNSSEFGDGTAKQNVNHKPVSLDYGDFYVRQFMVAANEFPAMVENVVNKGKLTFDENMPDIGKTPTIEGPLGKDFSSIQEVRPSNDSLYKVGWPTVCFRIEPAQSIRQSPPGNQLVAIGLPLYENSSQAISEVFGFDSQIASQSYGQVMFLLPNFSAKIAKVKLGSKNVSMTFNIGREGMAFQDLVLKMNCLSPQKQQSQQFERTLDGEELTVPLDFLPNAYSMYLLTKKGEILDYRRFNLAWPTQTDDVEIENTPENLEQIIAMGESEQIEFKLEFPKNNEDFAETVVAMSNGEGGTIFIGVDDKGSPIGIHNPHAEESIRDSTFLLRTECLSRDFKTGDHGKSDYRRQSKSWNGQALRSQEQRALRPIWLN